MPVPGAATTPPGGTSFPAHSPGCAGCCWSPGSGTGAIACCSELGVDDWMNACPWCGNDATGRDLIPRALTRVRRLLLVSRIRDWGYRVLLRARGGRLDECLSLVRQRRHRAGPHSPRTHPGAPAAAGLPDPGLGLSRAAPPGDLRGGPTLPQGGRDRAELRRGEAPAGRNPLDHAGGPPHPRAGTQLPISSLG